MKIVDGRRTSDLKDIDNPFLSARFLLHCIRVKMIRRMSHSSISIQSSPSYNLDILSPSFILCIKICPQLVIFSSVPVS